MVYSDLKVVFLLENSALCCISSGPLLYAKVPVYGFPVYKGFIVYFFLFFRLRIQYDGLLKEEGEQNEFIEQFVLQK